MSIISITLEKKYKQNINQIKEIKLRKYLKLRKYAINYCFAKIICKVKPVLTS